MRLTHLLDKREVGLHFAPDNSVVVVLTLLHFSKVEVLEGEVVISRHLPVDVVQVPCKLQLLFETYYRLSVLAELLIALAHHLVSKDLSLIVHVLVTGIS